jgi:cell division protein FtsB
MINIKKPKKKKKMIYRVRMGASSAAYNFLSAFGLFVGLLLVTVFFILFQWKNVKIRSYLQEIDRLNQRVLALNAENSRLESVRNTLEREVPDKAKTRLHMFVPGERPGNILVNRRQLLRYERKR